MTQAELPALTVKQKNVVVAGAMLALFLAALEQTIVATALPSIAGDLGDFHLLAWIVTAYLLTSTAATPVLGKLSDLYGRRLVTHLCLAVFVVGSVLCALADSMLLLILARALQGVGGGGLMVMAQTIVADVVTPRERGRYSGYFSAVWAGAALLGPSLGGLLTYYISWHWIFWINLPLSLAAFLVIDRVLKRLPRISRPAVIDWFSILCFVLSATALLLVLNWGGIAYSWFSATVLLTALATLLLGAVFVLRQRLAKEPVFPPHFVSDKVLAPILLAIFLVFGIYLALAVLTPTFLQVALGVPTDEVGLLMIPMMLSTPISATLAGHYISRTGLYKRPPLIGMPCSILALLVLAFLAEGAPPLLIALLLMLVGFGLGPIFPVSVVAAQNAVARRDLGAISGAIGFARALGAALATAVASTLVLRLIALWLPGAEGLSGLEDLARHPLDAAGRGVVADAFSVFYLAAAGVIAIGLLVFARVEARPLAGPPGGRPPA